MPQALQDQATSETEEEGSNRQSMYESLSYIQHNFLFLGETKAEPKKRRQENVASCEKCNVSFAKLLKRKVSLCQHVIVFQLNMILFSISAITVEQCFVDRARSKSKNPFLGPPVRTTPSISIVTLLLLCFIAPAAYSEVVRVCLDCNSQLEQMQQELSKYQSSVNNSSPV